MPDREKALQLLRDVRAEVDPDAGGLCDNDCKTVSAWLDEAMALLDDAVEPKTDGTSIYDVDGLIVCGKCGGSLGMPEVFKFCPWCGKAVKWND